MDSPSYGEAKTIGIGIGGKKNTVLVLGYRPNANVRSSFRSHGGRAFEIGLLCARNRLYWISNKLGIPVQGIRKIGERKGVGMEKEEKRVEALETTRKSLVHSHAFSMVISR